VSHRARPRLSGPAGLRRHPSDISDVRSHNLLVAVEVIKGAIAGSVRSRIPQFDAGPYDPLPGAASQIAKAGRPSPHLGAVRGAALAARTSGCAEA
jgi:hypothetical protein